MSEQKSGCSNDGRIAVPAFDRKLMTCRVFWQHTEGGEPDDGAWYWVETDGEGGEAIGDMFGPFESALEAGKHARKAVVARASI